MLITMEETSQLPRKNWIHGEIQRQIWNEAVHKIKTNEWGFKLWFRCSSKSSYLYQMDIYLGRKQKPKFSLGLRKKVVLQLTKDLDRSFFTVHFDNFFNSPKVIEQLFQKDIYGIETVWANRKQMPKMVHDKQMKSGDCEFLFSGNTMTCRWIDNRSMLLLSSALDGMNGILSVQRREKGSKTKSTLQSKVVKLYNSGMGGVDLRTGVLPHIVWIKSHLLDFTSAFSSICWILHLWIVTSFITWSILTNCLSLITRLLLQKT